MGIVKSTEHRVKAGAFGLFRPWFRRGRRDFRTVGRSSIKRVLFLRPEKIGDMVISFPVFDGLKSKWPDVEIGLVASPRSFPLVKDDPRFTKIYVFSKGLKSTVKMIRQINRDGWDCVLDMIDNDSVTTLFMSQLIGRRRRIPRIGIGKERHARYYDFNFVHEDGIGSHIVDNTLGLLVAFGIDIAAAERYAAPYITRDASRRADEIFEDVPPGLRVGFNLSAGKPNRLWPTKKAVALANRLLELREDLQIVLIVSPDDRARGEEVQTGTGGRAHLVPPGLQLLDVCALIGGLDLLISPDTSLIHVARSFRVPVVGLYSDARKNFTRWRPYGQPDGAVVAHDDDTIYDITVEQVLDRVQQVLQRERPVRL